MEGKNVLFRGGQFAPFWAGQFDRIFQSYNSTWFYRPNDVRIATFVIVCWQIIDNQPGRIYRVIVMPDGQVGTATNVRMR